MLSGPILVINPKNGKCSVDTIDMGKNIAIKTERKKKVIKTQAVGKHAESNQARLNHPVRQKVLDAKKLNNDLHDSNVRLKREYTIAKEVATRNCKKMENTINVVNIMTQEEEHSRLEKDPLLCINMFGVMTLHPSGSSGGGRRSMWDVPTKPQIAMKFDKMCSDIKVLHMAVFLSETCSKIALVVQYLLCGQRNQTCR